MRNKLTKQQRLVSLILLCLGLLGGCVTTWDYPRGPVVSKSDGYSMSLPRGWTYITYADGKGFIATHDGPSLQALIVRDQSLKKELQFSEALLNAEMTAEQLVDAMYENVLKNSALSGVTLEKAGPAKLGSRDGFQLIYTYTVASGLRYRENMTGAIKDGLLVTVVFKAPTRHYYDQYDDLLPRVLSSFRFGGE